MPEDDADLRKKVQDVWGSTLSGVELPGQSIKPAAARQTMAAPGAEPTPLPTVPLGTPKGEAPSPAAQIEILDVIGEGGMGTIYRARQVSLDREVALKQIKPHLEMKQEAVDMFLGEAHATGALDHPNIVPVHELGRDDQGRAFYSMKLVRGIPWDKLLHPETDEQRARAEAMSVRDHLDILLKVSDAISFAHSRGVIHRDLKPENVMVGEFGEVLVMDWGLAAAVEPGQPATRRLPDVKKITSACGTPSYMPPEMALGEGYRTCPASDVYLLGGVLFEILFGKPPHEGETVWAVLWAASENRIAKPEKVAPEVRSYYQALRVTLNKSLNIHPARRQPDARAFGEEVREALSHFDSVAMATDAHDRIGELVAETKDATPARARKLYAGFAESIAGLKQSLRSWPENPLAGSWLAEAHVAYARLALAMSDFGLAEAQIAQVTDPDDEAKTLRREIRSAHKQALARERAARLMRWGLSTAAALVFAVVTAAFFWIRSEQQKTAKALADFKAEQEQRLADRKRSAPGLVDKARKEMSMREFDYAMQDVELALEYDPGLAPAHVVRAQLLIQRRDFAGAAAELEEYVRLGGKDASARELLELCRRCVGSDSGKLPLGEFAGIFGRQGALALAAEFSGSAGERLKVYRAQIEKAWPGLGSHLTQSGDGKLQLDVSRFRSRESVANLSPLRGIPLSVLRLTGTNVSGLHGLDGMPLRELNASECDKLVDISALRGTPIEKLDLMMHGRRPNRALRSLDGLQGTKLNWLSLRSCTAVVSLAPLKGQPLRELDLTECRSLRSLDGLEGMRLERIELGGCSKLPDISVLKGMPLRNRWLNLSDCRLLRSLDGLQGAQLTELAARGCASLADITALRGMPLERLHMSGCLSLKGLEGLQGTRLKELDLRASRRVADISALRGLPIEKLDLGAHSGPNVGLRSLEGLRGTKLEWLDLKGCQAVESLEPLRGLPITWLNIESCHSLRNLDALEGMRLTELVAGHVYKLESVSGLRGMRLEKLSLKGSRALKSLDALRGMPLKRLDLAGCRSIRDIAVLKGMPLETLVLAGTGVRDLSPLVGMPLVVLNLDGTPVNDLGELKGLPLERLDLTSTGVADLSPLRGMPLTYLRIERTPITDLTPLAGMKLERLIFYAEKITKGLDVVRRMKSISKIGPNVNSPMHPRDFWKKFDVDGKKR